jgi:hypothetical protein
MNGYSEDVRNIENGAGHSAHNKAGSRDFRRSRRNPPALAAVSSVGESARSSVASDSFFQVVRSIVKKRMLTDFGAVPKPNSSDKQRLRPPKPVSRCG